MEAIKGRNSRTAQLSAVRRLFSFSMHHRIMFLLSTGKEGEEEFGSASAGSPVKRGKSKEESEMWDLTPDTDLLKELPDDYTFETALADLIGKNGSIIAQISKRESHRGQTPISNGNSGLSGIPLIVDMHPFFGMFGYGGPVATMCLGRRCIVSSKTKNRNKVFTLHLEREALVSSSCSESCWKTKGGIRDPLEDEKENSPHGSFTKVNGEDLVGIQGGEVATTYLHSCNGPNFILQLHFSNSQDTSSLGQCPKVLLEANARLKCVYFPIIKGKESIQKIIDELEADGCGIRESYESFSRVSVRRLGRLLPDTRWMDLAHHHPYTKALKNFGNRVPDNEKGEARLICRYVVYFISLETTDSEAVFGEVENCRNPSSINFPLIGHLVYQKQKCLLVDDTEWESKLQTYYYQKLPSAIDLLSDIDCHELKVDGGLPVDVVQAGDAPPENIVAVIRPKAFNPENSSKRLDQKFIVRDSLDMSLEVNFRDSGENVGSHVHVYSVRIAPSSCKGLHGFYIFPLKSKCPALFHKAGSYALSFSLNGYRDVRFEKVVQVQAAANVGSWKVISHKLDAVYTVRVGSCFEPLSIGCYDRYNNSILFTSVPKLIVKLVSNRAVLAQVRTPKVDVTADKLTVKLKGIVVKSSKLDDIRPTYEAALSISTPDEAFSVAFPCRVIPGNPYTIIAHPRKLKMQLIPGHIVEELALEVFDEYGNHAKEDEKILLSLDGFSFQDESNILHDGGVMYYVKKLAYERIWSINDLTVCLLGIQQLAASANVLMPDPNHIKLKTQEKVAANGFVELSNSLKVSKGYGKDVLLSATFRDRVIFTLNFQTEKREIRTASKVFKNCEAGSQLENIVFEVVNPEGEVDESIHDEEKHGQSHTLTIKSNSFDIDDSVRYSFRHGRCTIRSIPLPHKEGIFSFSAVHFRYPELNLDIEVDTSMQVHVEKTWQGNFAEMGNYEDEGNPIFSPQNSCQENLLSLPHSPAPKVPEVVNRSLSPQSSSRYVVNRSLSPQSSSRYVLPIGYLPSPKTPKLESRNENSDISPILELEDDLTNCGMRKMGRERNIEILNTRRSHIEQHISVLQASIDGDLRNATRTCAKELIQKQIESKSQSASAVICRLHEEVPFESRPRDILGIVALLGTVESIEISRILAQYLGEDQMRAIVCKNYAAAHCLETNTLHELATKFGKSISGGYLALCLEDVRPITSGPSTNPQELLPLQKPTLPNGDVPQGFIGYAVNMISTEASYLRWRTKSGHGLRETLFYRLFGELQVYRNRDCMMSAQSCIKNGAVSLDGGIMRGNGLVSLGHWEPDILFPVQDKALTPQSLKSLQMLERKKRELTELNRQIDEESKALEQDRIKLEMSRDRYNSYMSQNGSSSAARRSLHY
ncbi:UNVERIFIED_CONTAM: Structural maintenance of chromosomes flexible hinge domain-containing protein GMI1 [Sesamum indicum]